MAGFQRIERDETSIAIREPSRSYKISHEYHELVPASVIAFPHLRPVRSAANGRGVSYINAGGPWCVCLKPRQSTKHIHRPYGNPPGYAHLRGSASWGCNRP